MGRIFGTRPTPNEQLKQARNELGLKEHEIAARIGIDSATYCRWEKGQQRPRLRHLRALCEILGKKPEEIGYNPADL